MPNFILIVIALLCTIAQAQPISNKLNYFVRDLYHPQRQVNLLVVGDSINASNSPDRMAVGYRNQLQIPWNGWVCHADSGVSDNGYTNGQNVGAGGVNTIRIPGEIFYASYLAISPVRTRDLFYNQNVSSGGTLIDSALPPAMLNAFPLGNPFASSITAKIILFHGSLDASTLRVQSTRNGSVQNTVDYTISFPADSIYTLSVAVPPGTGYPGLRTVSTGTTLDQNIVVLGVQYLNSGFTGVQFAHIAHGGWTISDHLNTGKYSNAALAAYGEAIGGPTHIMIWLGQNMTVAESNSLHNGDGSVYKNDLQALIERYADIWPSAKFLLISQFKTGYSEAVHVAIATLQYNLSQEMENVSSFNLYAAAGGQSFSTEVYTSDGIHPNLAGSNYLASLMETAFNAASCLADFDGSTFVDIADYDSFIEAFELGLPTADLDMSGFVDIEDFDLFIQRFEEGC